MNGLAIGNFIGGAVTIFLFVLGILLIRFRNSWTGCPFGFFGIIICLLTLGVGIAIVAPNTA